MTTARYGAVILAAGGSTRLGRPKQLLQLRGEALVRRAARIAAEAGLAPVIVVAGAASAEVEAALAGGGFAVAIHPGWSSGVASSIRRGLEVLSELRPGAEGVLLSTCDQPLVEAVHLAALADALESGGHLIAASSYGGTVGVPALFSRAVFGELRSLQGEHGAKRVITWDPARVARVSLAGGECDIDTEADWSALGRGDGGP